MGNSKIAVRRVAKSGVKSWLKELQGLVENKAETVPEGWVTTTDLSAQTGTPLPTVSQKLRRLVAEGKAESRKFRVNVGNRIVQTIHYKLCK